MPSHTSSRMLALVGVAVGGLFLAVGLAFRGERRADDVPLPRNGAVVIAELFTSEGCSSCPPADDVLSQLVHEQPVAGVEVLGLGEHVDYWNRLGWSDPFSSAAFSARQSEYAARVFHTDGVYTPQLVIDGRLQAVGSDRRTVRRAIAQAAQDLKATVSVLAVMQTPTDVRVDVRVDIPPQLPVREVADLVVALTEDHLMSDVRRGENGGRTLRHSAVVRSLAPMGGVTPPMRALSTTTSVRVAPTWKIQDLRATAFLQERQSRRIIGAAAASVDLAARSS